MAIHDPLVSARNTAPSEYVGVGGLVSPVLPPQAGSIGAVAGHTLTVAQKRMIAQREMIASAGVMEDLDPTDEHYQAVVNLAAKRREIYASGHTLDDALSDT